MPPILTPSHELAPDVWLSLTLVGLAPAVLASWLQARFPGWVRRLPIGWYSCVLLAVTVAGYVAIGRGPRLFAELPAVGALLAGLALGLTAIGIELGLGRLLRGWRRRRPRAGRRGGAAVPADLPGGEDVVWRLNEHETAWDENAVNLLLPAVLEEMIYRQTLLALLAPVTGAVPAAVASTIAFGLIHLYFGAGAVVSKLLVGGVFAAAVLAGAGLLPVILGHLMLNASALALRSSSPSLRGWRWLAGGRA